MSTRSAYELDAIPGERPLLCLKCLKADLQLRTGKHGLFLSCSNFPSCRGSMSLVLKKGDKVKWKEPGRKTYERIDWDAFEEEFFDDHSNHGDR